VVVLALLTSIVGAYSPEPATAAVNNPVPANQFGDPATDFTEADAIYAYFTSDLQGGRICVIAISDPATGCGGESQVIGGQIGTGFILLEPKPWMGQFRILTTDQFDNPIDLSIPFTVAACEACPRGLTDAIVGSAKVAASEMFQAIDGLHTTISLLEKVAGRAVGMRGISQKVPPNPRSIPDTPVEKAYAGFALVATASNVTFVLADPATTNINAGLSLLKYVHSGASLMFQGIADDPPDPNYDEIEGPIFLDLPGDSSPPELAALLEASDRQWAYAQAALRALERYQEAQLAGDLDWQIAQLDTLAEMSLGMADAVDDSVTRLDDWADVAELDPELSLPAVTADELDDLIALYQRIRADGFLPEEIAQYQALGYTDQEISNIRTHFDSNVEGLVPEQPYPEFLRQVADAIAPQAQAFRDLAREAHVVAGRLGLDVGDPVASFTFTPADPVNGELVRFTDTSTDDGTIASRSWDFDDGSTSTAQNPSHTFAAPGEYTVSLTVTDDEGRTDTDVQVITVGADPVPTASFTVTPTSGVAGQPLEVDASASIDHDGSIDSYLWDFGDGTNGIGVSTTHQYSKIGTYRIVLTVTDNDGNTDTSLRDVAVLAPSGAQPPTAKFTYEPFTITEGSTVRFIDLSTDPDGEVTGWRWTDAGGAPTDPDRFTSDEQSPTHTYGDAGPTIRPVSLTAEDDIGLTDVDERYLQVNPFPVPSRGQCNGGTGEPDSSGSEFMLVAPARADSQGTSVMYLSVLISAEEEASGFLEIPSLGFEREFSIGAGESTEITLPAPPTRNGGITLWDSDYVGSSGIRVCADTEVGVWLLGGEPQSSDGYLGLPVDQLGTSYVISAFPHGSESSNPRFLASEFAIVATEDDTEVTIVPSADTEYRAAGEPYTILLHRFYTYQLQTGPDPGSTGSDHVGEDLTGTIISSTAPIAVVAGARCAVVGEATTSQQATCDHIVEQMRPTQSWGRDFLIGSLAERNGDQLRVLAQGDGTIVTIDGAEGPTLDGGESTDFDIAPESAIRIQASHPVTVTQFAKSAYAGFDESNDYADPFALTLVPIDQFRASYVWHNQHPRMPTGGEIFHVTWDHFATAIVPSAAVTSCVIDGATVTEPFNLVGDTGYSIARIRLEAGSHGMSCWQPFGLYLYGFARFESYGYPAGYTLVDPPDANSPPAAVDDTFDTDEDTPLVVSAPGVLGNDSDLDGDEIQLVGNTEPANGTLTIGPEGSLTYTPDTGHCGSDGFRYTISDGTDTATATVDIDIGCLNGPPVAVDDTFDTDEDTPLVVSAPGVLGNDSDPDGDEIQVVGNTEPANGTLTIGPEGSLTYTPDTGHMGSDSFTYTISDGTDTATATVTIAIEPKTETGKLCRFWHPGLKAPRWWSPWAWWKWWLCWKWWHWWRWWHD
jgi:PKD repeat protein